MRTIILPLIILLSAAVFAQSDSMFPWQMPWDDASVNITDMSGLNAEPAGAQGFVRADKGHLYVKNERFRMLGVNIVFGSGMTSHEEADKQAARLARFGINCVRFHHMDSHPAPDGLLNKDMRTFNADSLERLDYFIAALKKHGIYSNINLHVGRIYPGYTQWGPNEPQYWKGVDNFFRPMIEMQKEYARDLLTHKNSYTGNMYINEPAVALIEINNENGLLSQWKRGELNDMTDPFRSDLRQKWNSWLKKKYRTEKKLGLAWKLVKEPQGAEMFGSDAGVKPGAKGWNLQLVGDAKAELTRDGDVLTLEMMQSGRENWHTQLHQNGLAFTEQKPYTLTVTMKADKNISMTFIAMQAHAPWQRMWSEECSVGTDWKTYSFTFAPVQSDAVSRLTATGISLVKGKLFIKNAHLTQGGSLGLKEGESLDSASIDIFGSGNYLGRTVEGQRDWLRFLWETETNYWKEMYAFIKKDLKAKPLILGTQVSYSPATIQSELDIVDGHAYWQHPHFPGKPWDQNNWDIGNTPMSGIESGGTIPDLALRRVPGKPFIVTEYNHPSPSYFQAEALTLLSAYAALQDWDGIFLYSYGAHMKNWDPGFINNFFDSNANPVKMTSFIPASFLFRRADVSAADSRPLKIPSPEIFIEQIRSGKITPSAEYGGTSRADSFIRQTGIADQPSEVKKLPYVSETKQLSWGENGGKTVTVNTLKSKGVIGAVRGYTFDADGVVFDFRDSGEWSVVLADVVKGKDFSSKSSIVVTALGKEENTDQKWVDDKKRSIGKNWGRGPVLVEGVRAVITVPAPASKVSAWSLDERGNRKAKIEVTGKESASIKLSGSHKTLWYEIEIQ